MSAEVSERLGEREIVARCAIFPQFVPRDGPATAFDHRQLVYFRRLPDKRWAVSVGWRNLLRGLSDVHHFGCRTAANSNARRAEKKGEPLEAIEETVHYIGFYDLDVEFASKCSDAVYEVYAEHSPELGEDAHSHIILDERSNVSNNTPKASHRTQIVDGLWKGFYGPERHICECDIDHREFLSSISIPTCRAV